jgi:hypothetical protein
MAKSTSTTLMDKSMKIFVAAFKKPMKDKSPRQTALHHFATKLEMPKTKAATYYSLCMKKVRESQSSESLQSKTVHTAVKVDENNIVTSFGHFMDRNAALEFNAAYQHDGIVKGVVAQGDVIDPKRLKTA